MHCAQQNVTGTDESIRKLSFFMHNFGGEFFFFLCVLGAAVYYQSTNGGADEI